MTKGARFWSATLFGIPVPVFLFLPVLSVITSTCEGTTMTGADMLREGSSVATRSMSIKGAPPAEVSGSLLSHAAVPLAGVLVGLLIAGVMLSILLRRWERPALIANGVAILVTLVILPGTVHFSAEASAYPATGWLLIFACVAGVTIGHAINAFVGYWRRQRSRGYEPTPQW
jgi:hypothetical protein